MKRNFLKLFAVLVTGAVIFTSCNKDLDEMPAIATPTNPTGAGMAGAIAGIANDSLYYKVITKSGLAAMLNNNANSYTMFVPDNAGMKVFLNKLTQGALPLAAPDVAFASFINSANFPASLAQAIVLYNTLGGKFPSASIASSFPNYPLPSQLILDQNQPFVRMVIAPSKRGSAMWVNNVPVTAVDLQASNGIIHHTYTVVLPPVVPRVVMLRDTMYNRSDLTYFKAAIARGDSGQVVKPNNDSTNFFHYLLGYGAMNMTVVAPNDAAFQNLIFGMVYQKVLSLTGNATLALSQANAAVAAGPAFLYTLPVAQVRGILAYHILAGGTTSVVPNIRVFSNNFFPAPTFVKTLVNSSIAAHPGVEAKATFTGPVVSSLTFSGYSINPSNGTLYATGTAANAVAMDLHAVNGVYHVIDKVLLPQ